MQKIKALWHKICVITNCISAILGLVWRRFCNYIGSFVFPTPYLITYLQTDSHGNSKIDSIIVYMGIIRIDYINKILESPEYDTSFLSVTALPRSSVRMYRSGLARYLEKEALKHIDALKEAPKQRVDADADPDEVEKQELDELESMLLGK